MSLNVLVTFFVEGIPIGYAAIEETDVDIVEVVGRIYPVATAVVDLESQVGCELIFLDAGKIGG